MNLNEQLGKIFIKYNISLRSYFGSKLGDNLCSINKSKHKKIDQKGLYK